MTFDERVEYMGRSYYVMGHYDGCRVNDRTIAIVDRETQKSEVREEYEDLPSPDGYGCDSFARYLEMLAIDKHEERIREDME